jgi:hypothetical protein
LRRRASQILAASAPEWAQSRWRRSLQASSTDLGAASTSVAISRLLRGRCRSLGWSGGRQTSDLWSYWDEWPRPKRPFQFGVRDCLWSQGLLSPLQLVSEVLGFPPELNLDLLLSGRGQDLNRPLGGLRCFCIPLDFVEKPGEKRCLGLERCWSLPNVSSNCSLRFVRSFCWQSS